MELMALGAPRELIEATTRAIADEIRHAQTSFSIASSFAWQPLGPSELDTTPASHGPVTPERVLRGVLAEGCIGETLAAAQAMTQATQVDDPELRQALETIAHEEGEHAELAWQIAAWMLGKWPELRPVAQAVLFGEPIREVGPWIDSMTAIQEVMLRHGAMTPAPQDAARRRAFHAIVNIGMTMRVMPITEVGEDFITRMHVIMRGTTAYAPDEDEDEFPADIPDELQEMRAAFQAAKGKLSDPKSKIIERVLERNLMEPSSLTFFDDQEAAFFIVEPHIREADLKEFAELS